MKGKNEFNFLGINKVTGTEYDVNGYDVNGYDKRGYDKRGFNIYGRNMVILEKLVEIFIKKLKE